MSAHGKHARVTRFWSTHKYNHMHCCAEGLALQCLFIVNANGRSKRGRPGTEAKQLLLLYRNLMVGFVFYLKAFYHNNLLFFVINKVVYIHTLQIMRLPLGLPSHLSSLLPFPKKTNRNKSQKSFLSKNKYMQEQNAQKPTKLDGNDTRLFSYILYHFVNYICTQNCLHALAKSHPLKECITTYLQDTSTAHSTSFCIQDNPYVPCSTATKVHNITHT